MLKVDGKDLSLILVCSLDFALSNISLFATDITVLCSDTCKGEAPNINNFLVTENIDLCLVEHFMKTCYIVLVKGTVDILFLL